MNDPTPEELEAIMETSRKVIPLTFAKDREEKKFEPWFRPDELDDIQPDEYLVDEWLPQGGVHLIYADKDCFKSFIALDWCLCVATGKAWHGFDVKKGLGLYIAGEGVRGLKRRAKAWSIKNGFDLGTINWRLSKLPMQVLDEANISRWRDAVEDVEREAGEKVRLVVIDTLATNFGPGDENSNTDMARFLSSLMINLQRGEDVTILVVHHKGKNKTVGARGGSSIEANAEGVYTVEREQENDESWDRTVTLKCKHLKDDEKPPDLRFKGNPVNLGVFNRHGEELTSLVMELELNERETLVLNQTNAGCSQRQIAEFIGVSRNVVARIQRRLKAQKVL